VHCALTVLGLCAGGCTSERGASSLAEERSSMLHSQTILPAGFTLHATSDRAGPSLPFVVYTPRRILRGEAREPLPLILFLHGSGESGTDGLKHVGHSLGLAVQRDRERWPAVMVMPQKPMHRVLWPVYEAQVMEALQTVRDVVPVDPTRIYLTGLSQGGHGSWMLGARHAKVFAAIAPICGWTTEGFMPEALSAMPIWAFHGDADDIINVKGTIDASAQVQAAGGAVRMTIYPGVKHNSWDAAYSDPELAAWLFSQRKPESSLAPSNTAGPR
jgi:predicted peptidase